MIASMTRPESDRFTGRTKRVTITLPEDLEAAVKNEIGSREFSAYITEAVAKQYQLEQLGKILDEMDEKYGPIPEEIRRQTAAAWPDAAEWTVEEPA
jgi:hypothetical protein